MALKIVVYWRDNLAYTAYACVITQVMCQFCLVCLCACVYGCRNYMYVCVSFTSLASTVFCAKMAEDKPEEGAVAAVPVSL